MRNARFVAAVVLMLVAAGIMLMSILHGFWLAAGVAGCVFAAAVVWAWVEAMDYAMRRWR